MQIMKKTSLLLFVLFISHLAWTQTIYNPNVAIKPIPSLSVYKVEMLENTTAITFRIINNNQLPPFSLKSKNMILREVSDTMDLHLIRSENAKFSPEQHVFSYIDEIYEFTLVFGGLIQPVKYIDVVERTPERDFYVQGIILDEDLNTEITRGFMAYQNSDPMGAVEHFVNFIEMDLYFEYGFAYFFVLNILASQNEWDEAKKWYNQFKNKFFYDKQLHVNALQKMGVIQRLEEIK